MPPELYADDNGNRVLIRHKGPAGKGLPPGGTTGQIYVKASNADYDGAWANPPNGTGAAVGPNSSVDGNIVLFDGTTGKLLKDSGKALSYYASLSLVNTKVDKVAGKGLSENDFTDADKAKLDALSTGGFRGVFADKATGESTIVDPQEGDYFFVEVAESAITLVLWDSTNAVWTEQTYEISFTSQELADLIFNEDDVADYDPVDSRVFTSTEKAQLANHEAVLSAAGASITAARGALTYFNLTGTAVTISAASDGSSNMVKVDVPSTIPAIATGFDNGGASNGRLRYTGSATKTFLVTVCISNSGASGDVLVIGVAKNGTVDASTKVLEAAKTSGTVSATTLTGVLQLAQNDYLEVFIGNTTDTSSPTVHALSITAVAV